MNYIESAKIDNLMMNSLKVKEFSHIIAQTDKGILTLKITKGGTNLDYQFFLDSIPVEGEINKELLELWQDNQA